MLRPAVLLVLPVTLVSLCGPPDVGAAPEPRSTYTASRAELAEVATTGGFSGDASTGYDRSCRKGHACVFGKAWTDGARGVALSGNGCDTRNDVLARDLTGVRKRGRCKVLSGTVDDPYSGGRVSFSSADPEAVQIDHVVALAYAWRAGARSWTAEQRTALANDPDNLRAVSGAANQAKGDSGPDEWLPENADHRCSYVASWVKVAHRYRLTVLTRDWEAADEVLRACEAAAPEA